MAESKKKICQNCQASFTIDASDFLFYEKIKVPPPTFCPKCRFLRRALWRNEIFLYKRPDSRTGRIIFSMYPGDSPIKVWEKDDWWSDIWDPLEYGKQYDFSKPFFEQLKELLLEVPWSSKSVQSLVRSDYSNNASYIKDCYLVFATGNSENCYYSDNLSYCKDCYDSSYTGNNEISYESFFNKKCYRSFFSSYCENSSDIFFCRDCIGVNNCFGCVGLRNKSYHIFNQSFSREEYFKKIKSFNLGSFKSLFNLKEKLIQFWLQFPVKYMHGRHNSNAKGEYIYNSKNVINSYHIVGGENLKFCQGLGFGKPACDSYDHFRWGMGSELIYETAICGDNVSNLKFCYECFPNCKDLIYSIWCHSSSDLFGCIGLRHKQYCILNKQYTKEEYERLVLKIIEHMNEMPYIDKKGRVYKYGEFFPPELSPFCYNETIAQEYFPLTKEEALKQGFSWKNPEERDIKIDIKTEDLPDNVKDVDDSIIGKIIQCGHAKLKEDGTLEATCNEQCTTAFKIIEPELEFYRKMNLPLPRLCPNCRHYQRLKQRNPLKLWQRKCMCGGRASVNGVYQNTIEHFHGKEPCPNEFETTYSPDRPEIVYCEKCYLAEVV